MHRSSPETKRAGIELNSNKTHLSRSTIKRSCRAPPACSPQPTEAMANAEGGDQSPRSPLTTTSPEPIAALHPRPTCRISINLAKKEMQRRKAQPAQHQKGTKSDSLPKPNGMHKLMNRWYCCYALLSLSLPTSSVQRIAQDQSALVLHVTLVVHTMLTSCMSLSRPIHSATSQHLTLMLLACCCSVCSHLSNRQYGKPSSALQDSCWYALLRLQVPNLGKAVEYVGGLVDVRLQATAQWAVQPGSHHAAIRDIVDCWPHCLCNGACGAHPHHSAKCQSRNAYSSVLTTVAQAS